MLTATSSQPTQPEWPPHPLPVPPDNLADGFELRAWRIEDAPALVTAWNDESIQRWLAPPHTCLTDAQAWIRGAESRRVDAISLDLVIDIAGIVVGEIGFSGFDRSRRAALIGYWIAADHRRRGLAARAVSVAARWFLDQTGASAVVAECNHANTASHGVAQRAGLVLLGEHGENLVYALTQAHSLSAR